jgi:hypothetical protein
MIHAETDSCALDLDATSAFPYGVKRIASRISGLDTGERNGVET